MSIGTRPRVQKFNFMVLKFSPFISQHEYQHKMILKSLSLVEHPVLIRRFFVVFLLVTVLILFQGLFPPLENSPIYLLENFITKLLIALLLAIVMVERKSHHLAMSLLLGASVGLLFFINILGLNMVVPTSINWVMRGDWAWHFLGWHFFRNEAWHWPLGKITDFLFPSGTSVGYTDSLPLLAFLLKPLHQFLPTDFQYIGLWFFSSYLLQGIFAALLMRLVTENVLIQILGTLFFVMNPILLQRLGHDTLCTHWLLLAGLWMYFREPLSPSRALKIWLGLIVLSALIHPYLLAMVFGLMSAFYLRFWLIERQYSLIHVTSHWALLGIVTVLIWWQVGYFLIEDKTSSGLGYYSMNLLAPFNAMGGGTVLFRDIPVATEGQAYEGFNYLGAGVLLLGLWALYELNQRPASWSTVKKIFPLAIICMGFTVFAVSNKVTLANKVLFDFQSELLNIFAIFRSSGRFFWPVNYTLIFLILSVLIQRHSSKTALVYLSFGLSIQFVDLYQIFESHRQVRATPALHWNAALPEWENPLQSSFWKIAAPHYQHLTLVFSPFCGNEAAPYLPFSYFAASHGLTINTGVGARIDVEKMMQYCRTLQEEIQQGRMREDSLYIFHPIDLAAFKKLAQVPIICRKIDGFDACVTETSFEQWKVQWEADVAKTSQRQVRYRHEG